MRLKKQTLFFLIFLFLISTVLADTGYVNITIKNDPPKITGMVINEPYDSNPLVCDVSFEDELDEIQFEYTWEVNGKEIEFKSKELPLQYFSRQDEVTCEAKPYDGRYYGEPKKITIQVKKKPITETVNNALTGMVTAIDFKGLRPTPLLGLTVMGLMIVNIAYYFKKRN